MTRIETLVFVQAVQRASMDAQVQRVLETTVIARSEPKIRVERDDDQIVETYSGLRVHALNREMSGK